MIFFKYNFITNNPKPKKTGKEKNHPIFVLPNLLTAKVPTTMEAKIIKLTVRLIT